MNETRRKPILFFTSGILYNMLSRTDTAGHTRGVPGGGRRGPPPPTYTGRPELK